MKLPPVSYGVSEQRLIEESPAYYYLIIRAGNKDPRRNVAFRKDVRDRCRTDKTFRELVWEICKREPLFWVNTFCVVMEPRGKRGNKVLPYITYEMQDRYVLDVYPCQGVRPTITLKSRDTSWTWMMYGIIRPHRFIFSEGATAICGSRQEKLVDSTENPDTMFAKFDSVMSRLPWWMAPEYDPKENRCRRLCHRFNPENGAVMTGAGTAEDIGRGGRRTEGDIDELASWEVATSYAAEGSIRFVTNCVNYGSTPCGDVGAFRDAWFNEQSPALKIELKWEDHPVYRRGMYSSNDGNLVLMDDEYWGDGDVACWRWVGNKHVGYTKDTYPFILDNEVRSPWFDAKEAELGSPVRVAQELRRSFTGSDSPFFDHATLLRLEAKYAKPYLRRVKLTLDSNSCTVRKVTDAPADGPLLLWCELDEGNHPPRGEYAIGVDVSAGSRGAKASNSVISVFNRRTGMQVAEFVANWVKPGRLGEYANAIGRMFYDAIIGWEAGTHGDTFMDRLWNELHYPNVYYQRQNEQERGVKEKRSPGWWVRPKTKMAAFNEFAAAQSNEVVKLVSADCIREQRQFIWAGPEEVVHRRSLSAESPSERKGSHGDRVSAVIVAFKILDEMPLVVPDEVKTEKPWTINWLLKRQKARTSGPEAFCPLGKLYGD